MLAKFLKSITLQLKQVVLLEDPSLYAFLWIGIVIVMDLFIPGLLALILAAPVGVFIPRILNRRQN